MQYKNTEEPGWLPWEEMSNDDRIGAMFCSRRLTKARKNKRKGQICKQISYMQSKCLVIPGRTVLCKDCFEELYPNDEPL